MNSSCTFCDRSKTRNALITETDNFYVTASLGQITAGYILLIPKRHAKCLGELNGAEIDEFTELTAGAANILRTEFGKTPITFEHGIVGQTIGHAHLHMLPTNIRFHERVMTDFPGCGIGHARSLPHLCEMYSRHPSPYLYWSDVYGSHWMCWDPPAPAQYLRTIAAELLGRPERADWKKMDPNLDKKLLAETISRLRPQF